MIRTLMSIALGMGVLVVTIIIVGVLAGQSYVAGQSVAAAINNTQIQSKLIDTWSKVFDIYAMFGTWTPIIFIALFGGLAIAALAMLMIQRGRGGGGGGGVF